MQTGGKCYATSQMSVLIMSVIVLTGNYVGDLKIQIPDKPPLRYHVTISETLFGSTRRR